ncbi:hypothetical protein HKX48_003979 [Thoreauomyces humboldtii]|nr:hypothetical protein HKX48_003979 [Thoreauomyces humboldtii]
MHSSTRDDDLEEKLQVLLKSDEGPWLGVGTLDYPDKLVPFLSGLEQHDPAVPAEWRQWPKRPKVVPLSAKNASTLDNLQYLVDCDLGAATYLVYARRPEDRLEFPLPPIYQENDVRISVRVFLLPEDDGGRAVLDKLQVGHIRMCRKALPDLLHAVNCSQEAWNNPSSSERIALFSQQSNMTRVSDIYASMPSPGPMPLQETDDLAAKALLRRCIDEPAPVGMRTNLFRYQRRTLWKMVQRETLPQRIIDPELCEFRTADTGMPYWLRISTAELLRFPVYYEESKGGIICEEMGTGKTCICIALILQTRHQSSCPPIDCVGGGIQLKLDTKWSRFLDEDDCAAAEAAGRVMFPTLKEMAAKRILLSRVPFRKSKDRLPSHLYKLLRNSPPFYLKAGPKQVRVSRYSSEAPRAMPILLSSTTLVVVPDTLVDQWRTELNKHVYDRELKILVITNPADSVPDAKSLTKYDIILISHPRFGRELGSLNGEADDYDGGDFYSPRSPLLSVRWLRLIVDEGHVMSSQQSPQVALAAQLACDRRWACSGTPMPNVLRAATLPDEQKDVHKLGGIIAKFLQIQPFASKVSFRTIVAKPFLERSFRGYDRLRDLMHRVMVRNQVDDVARDVRLPPLHESVTVLHFGRLQRLTHNCLVAFIKANAVLSEREHSDYFFHPRNAGPLRDVITNLQESCFWLSPKGFLGVVRRTLDNVYTGIDAIASSHQKDATELEEIERVLEDALNDELWVHIMKGEDLVYEVLGAVDDSTSHSRQLLVGSHLESQARKLQMRLPSRGDSAQLEVLATGSAKQAYLLSEILKYASTEKIIIYCQFEREIFYLHQMCRLAQKVSERSQSVTTFNTSDNAPVMIMDVKLGAWGIDLSSASRMYFLSPVWQHDMERQAIKRAHRIGAVRPIHIETLVISGTLEEAILSRRGELTSAESFPTPRPTPTVGNTSPDPAPVTTASKSFLDDSKLRNVLSSAKWIPDIGHHAYLSPVETPVPLTAAPLVRALGSCAAAGDYYDKPDESMPVPKKADEKSLAGAAETGPAEDDDGSAPPKKRVRFI